MLNQYSAATKNSRIQTYWYSLGGTFAQIWTLSFLYLSYLICLFVRFEKRIYIPLPEKNARTEIFKIHIGNTPNTLTDGDYRTLGAEAEGWVIYLIYIKNKKLLTVYLMLYTVM